MWYLEPNEHQIYSTTARRRIKTFTFDGEWRFVLISSLINVYGNIEVRFLTELDNENSSQLFISVKCEIFDFACWSDQDHLEFHNIERFSWSVKKVWSI